MKTIIAVLSIIVLAGCSSTTSQYYEAVEKAAKANSEAQKARYEALASIANSGGGEAASAAVMALALSNAPVVTPQPIQSTALQWAQALASPLSSLGMMYMQVDSTKTLAQANRDVSIAQVTASSADNQALYGVFGGITNSVAASNAAGVQAVSNIVGAIDFTPFVDGIVATSGQGFNAATRLGTAGINGIVDVSGNSTDAITNVVGQHNSIVNSLVNSRVVCSAAVNPLDGSTSVTCD